MLRISFIITYFNEPLQMLEECVQSVLSLPLLPMEREILLIDDGSTVPAPEFEGVSLSDKRIRVFLLHVTRA